jgi:endonuclease/exonuclease/phosphatase family metal-dependent hydrolase
MMSRSRARVLAVGLGLSLVVALGGCSPAESRSVTVMTRNLYLGGDITRPVRAAAGLTGAAALLALGHANHQLRAVVDQTDFEVRSRLLAGEIAGARPDLVGLQEVALWRHGPLQLDHVGRLDASEVDIDFLATLLADLGKRGVGYHVVRVESESDVEAPAFTGPLPGPRSTGSEGAARDVRLTIRDALLIRDDSAATVLTSGGGQYAARLTVPLGGVPFSFIRGFVWADIAIGPVRFRFLTTHLESQSADLALAQARELLAGPAADPRPTTVLVCDCNSDPSTTVPQPGRSAADAAAYELLTGRGGFQDAGLQPGAGSGPTGVLGELLNDTNAKTLNRRLDLVLARPGSSGVVQPVRGSLTGNQPADRDPATGLWPSDHAGVVFELRVR